MGRCDSKAFSCVICSKLQRHSRPLRTEEKRWDVKKKWSAMLLWTQWKVEHQRYTAARLPHVTSGDAAVQQLSTCFCCHVKLKLFHRTEVRTRTLRTTLHWNSGPLRYWQLVQQTPPEPSSTLDDPVCLNPPTADILPCTQTACSACLM